MTRPPPDALLAELTYRCPLRCGYCSNPTGIVRYTPELSTEAWARVMADAGAMGVLHAHLSGGEPLLRDDLEAIVGAARGAGLYVNLITSAWGLTEARTRALADAGVDHVQVSVQDSDAARADAIAGTAAHAQKLLAAGWVTSAGMAFSVNAVLHRHNLDRVGEIIALAESLGAERLELANTQFHGSAWENRASLLPSRAQLRRASEVARAAQERLRGVMDILWVIPDWYADLPRPCMDGWGRRFVTVAPDGTALPCPGAHGLPGMALESVRDRSLPELWEGGADFERFRGTGWMREPCASCERREVDHGGCRCQAMALTGDPARTDPACAKSPDHDRLVSLRRESDEGEAPPVLYRITRR
ncbi:MAG: pyrroloquinoline quinone biosynthesis protein PqqE [Polyangiales bacterium]